MNLRRPAEHSFSSVCVLYSVCCTCVSARMHACAWVQGEGRGSKYVLFLNRAFPSTPTMQWEWFALDCQASSGQWNDTMLPCQHSFHTSSEENEQCLQRWVKCSVRCHERQRDNRYQLRFMFPTITCQSHWSVRTLSFCRWCSSKLFTQLHLSNHILKNWLHRSNNVTYAF